MFSEFTISGSTIKALTIIAFFIAFVLALNFYLKEELLDTALISILCISYFYILGILLAQYFLIISA